MPTIHFSSSLHDKALASRVCQSFLISDRTYGARRDWYDILTLGQRCGLHRIERLMREQALRAMPRRRGLPKDHGQRDAIAGNVLDRQFQADAPKGEGLLATAAALDRYSHRIAG